MFACKNWCHSALGKRPLVIRYSPRTNTANYCEEPIAQSDTPRASIHKIGEIPQTPRRQIAGEALHDLRKLARCVQIQEVVGADQIEPKVRWKLFHRRVDELDPFRIKPGIQVATFGPSEQASGDIQTQNAAGPARKGELAKEPSRPCADDQRLLAKGQVLDQRDGALVEGATKQQATAQIVDRCQAIKSACDA